MEVHPLLERGIVPNEKLWYVFSTLGECPTRRVGHTCTFIPGENGSKGKIFVIGGATPGGSFSEVFLLDLDTLQWDTCESPGFKGRYEHTAFVPESEPHKVYIFGGAEQAGNMNDVQVYDTKLRTWTSIEGTGCAPSARTQHMFQAGVGDQFIVYSGGDFGATPVGDKQVYSFDTLTHSWRILDIQGKAPEPRHGHLLVGIGHKLFLHGGMSGVSFYDDLHVLDLEKKTWYNEKKRKGFLSARAAHSGVAVGKYIYVFGGMNKDGALDDTQRLNTETLKWSKIELGGPPPTPRLDFAMCPFQHTVRVSSKTKSDDGEVAQVARATLEKQIEELEIRNGEKNENGTSDGADNDDEITETSNEAPSSEQADDNLEVIGTRLQEASASPEQGDDSEDTEVDSASYEEKTMTLLFLHGGMDTEGNLWDDCLVLKVDDA